MKLPSDVVVGQHIQFVCLLIAAAIAAIYTLGYCLGENIHKLNNYISALYTRTTTYVTTTSHARSWTWLAN